MHITFNGATAGEFPLPLCPVKRIVFHGAIAIFTVSSWKDERERGKESSGLRSLPGNRLRMFRQSCASQPRSRIRARSGVRTQGHGNGSRGRPRENSYGEKPWFFLSYFSRENLCVSLLPPPVHQTDVHAFKQDIFFRDTYEWDTREDVDVFFCFFVFFGFFAFSLILENRFSFHAGGRDSFRNVLSRLRLGVFNTFYIVLHEREWVKGVVSFEKIRMKRTFSVLSF